MKIFISNSIFPIYINFIKKNNNNFDFIKLTKNVFILNKNCYSHINLFNQSIHTHIIMKNNFKNFKKIIIYSKAARFLINAVIARINII